VAGIHPLEMVWGWWAPLERFIGPERRLFGLLLILSLLIHGAGLALVGVETPAGPTSFFVGPTVTVLPPAEVAGAGPESLRLSLALEDPSDIALPRLISLFAHANPPAAVAAPLEPAQPEVLAARPVLPAEIGGLDAMAARMAFGRPHPAKVPVGEPKPAGAEARVLVGSLLAARFMGGVPRLEAVRRERPLEGPTVVSVGVGPEGMVREALVVTSCGAPEQDAVALRLVHGFRFTPVENRETVWSPVAFYWSEEGSASVEGP
jgi:TonB family protein